MARRHTRVPQVVWPGVTQVSRKVWRGVTYVSHLDALLFGDVQRDEAHQAEVVDLCMPRHVPRHMPRHTQVSECENF